jgi:DNA-binding transcriptional regulator GbsR (MarR family)
MNLTPLQLKFVLHWGEMGARWGVNRTIGQIHALLYLSEAPLHAEQIAETLAVARSNVSTSLKELQAFGLVRIAHVMGDRRDHFEAIPDVWDMFKNVIEERRRREIDPSLSFLRNCLLEPADTPEDARTQERIRQMHDFLEVGTTWLTEMRRLSPETLMSLARTGARIQQLLRGKGDTAAAVKDETLIPPAPM